MPALLKLYRPFESQVSRLTAVTGEFDRPRQSWWGENGHQKNVRVRIVHSEADASSDKIHFLASEEEVHLEIHNNPLLCHRLQRLLDTTGWRTFTRYSIARFIVDHGFELDYQA